jgi:ABC-type transporter Mla subunit MlaD
MTNEIKVGIVTLFALAMLVGMLWWGGSLSNKEKGWPLYVKFNNVAGLGSGARVRISGIGIGYVEKLKLEDGKAVAILRITSDVPLYEEYRFTVEVPTLLGESYVTVTPTDNPRTLLKSGDEVVGIPPVTLEDFTPQILAVVSRVEEVLGSLAEVIGSEEVKGSLGSMAQHMLSATKNIDVMTAVLRATVQAKQKDLENTLDSIEVAARHIERAASSASKLVGDPTLSTALVDSALSIKEASASIERTTSSLEAQLGDPGLEADLKATFANMHSATSKLDVTADKVARLVANPQFEGDLSEITSSGVRSAHSVEDASATIAAAAKDIQAMTTELRQLVLDPDNKSRLSSTLRNVEEASAQAAKASADVQELTGKARSTLDSTLSLQVTPRFESLYNFDEDLYQTRLGLDIGSPKGLLSLGASDLGEGAKLDLQAGLPLGKGLARVGVFSGEFGASYYQQLSRQLALDARFWDPNEAIVQAMLKYQLTPSLALMLLGQHREGDTTFGTGLNWQR